jgi:hypothetical protein
MPQERLEGRKNMNKKNDQEISSWEERTNDAALLAIAGELEASIAYAGAELTGFSVRLGAEETLMTIRVILAGRRQVCFIASGTIAQCFAKAVREAKKDKLRWKVDRYAKKSA